MGTTRGRQKVGEWIEVEKEGGWSWGFRKWKPCSGLVRYPCWFLTACLIGFDSQTKIIFYIEKKASFKDLRALVGLLYITSLAAAYNLLQLSSSSFSPWCKGSSLQSSTYLAWLCFFLDQAAGYVVFAGNLAATVYALLVVTGEENFQWLKWCDKYTRFSLQIGGSLLCGFVASLAMIFITSISAFNLFRFYSPTKLMHLKPKS